MSATIRALFAAMPAIAAACAAAQGAAKDDADADAMLSAVVRVRSCILPDARTAATLGVRRVGPAEHAGLAGGDLIVGVAGDKVTSFADFYRKIWARGAAGVEVPLRVLQGLQVQEISVRSIDRLEYFRRKPSY